MSGTTLAKARETAAEFSGELSKLIAHDFNPMMHNPFTGRRGQPGGRPPVNPSALFIKRPVATTLLTLGVALAGFFAYLKLPVAPLPQERSAEADRNRQWREVGVGAQILRDLGVTSIRHLTSSVHDYKGLSGFGIEIVSNEQLEG